MMVAGESPELKLFTTHVAYPLGRHAQELGALHGFHRVQLGGGDNHAPVAFAKEQRIQTDIFHSRQVDFRPEKTRVLRASSSEKVHSASATARPPSEQSCAPFTRSLWIRPSNVVPSVRSVSRLRGRLTGLGLMRNLQVSRAAQPCRASSIHWGAQKNYGVAVLLKPLRGHVPFLLHQPGHGHGGRGINRPVRILIVEHVAAGHRCIKGVQPSAKPRTASLSCQKSSGLCGFPKLKLSVVPIGVAPLQARLDAFSHRRLGAFVRIEVHVRRVAINRQRHKFLRKVLTIVATRHAVGLDANHRASLPGSPSLARTM